MYISYLVVMGVTVVTMLLVYQRGSQKLACAPASACSAHRGHASLVQPQLQALHAQLRDGRRAAVPELHTLY